jgi:4-carboxymuconolactone decarboxylase
MSSTSSPVSAVTLEDVRSVSPTLAKYTETTIVNDLWKRPELSARERSIITVSALITRNQTIGMLHYFNKALDSGVTPGELSEIITHVAFYVGWPNAFSAVAVAKDIFVQREVSAGQLPSVSPELLPIDQAVPDEAIRVAFVNENFRPVCPVLVDFTDDLLYHEVWLRPGLAPRDRNLATVSTLIASGQTAFIPFYLSRALRMEITKTQVSEMLTHLAFYAGWAVVLSTVATVKSVFDSQPD